jgi:hypothetical protein
MDLNNQSLRYDFNTESLDLFHVESRFDLCETNEAHPNYSDVNYKKPCIKTKVWADENVYLGEYTTKNNSLYLREGYNPDTNEDTAIIGVIFDGVKIDCVELSGNPKTIDLLVAKLSFGTESVQYFGNSSNVCEIHSFVKDADDGPDQLVVKLNIDIGQLMPEALK